MAQIAQFQTINVRPHARRNADKALLVLSFKGKKVSMVEFATNALNEKACGVLRKANLDPELP